MLRNSTEIGGKKWNKIVGIGHSYGSVQTQAVSAATPELYDAVILQGFSANATFLPRYLEAAAYSIARDVLPDHLSNKPTTWLATGSIASDQQGFFYFPYYSQASFDLARKTEQPVTLGSLFTVGVSAMPAPGFSKPVQVVTGAKDFIFTGSNAYAGANGMSIPAEVGPMLYPNSKGFETYIPANTGHAVNQHYSAAATYEKMLDFISRNNL